MEIVKVLHFDFFRRNYTEIITNKQSTTPLENNASKGINVKKRTFLFIFDLYSNTVNTSWVMVVKQESHGARNVDRLSQPTCSQLFRAIPVRT